MKSRVILAILLYSAPCSGGFERVECGGRPRSLGGAYVAVAGDAWCQLYNPAGLASVAPPEISWFVSPSPFSVPELSSMAGAFRCHFGPGSAGGVIRRFGYDVYRELSFNAGYALEVRQIAVGISAALHAVTIAGYGSAHALAWNLGGQAQISRSVTAGIALLNCTGATIGTTAEEIPRSIAVGIAYRASATVLLLLEWYRESPFDPAARAGFEFHPVDALTLRGGATDIPAVYSAGCGVEWKLFSLDYAVLVHEELGWTHEISVTFGGREP